MLITAGIWRTPQALTASKKTPWLVLAFPIVPQTISLPLSENFWELLTVLSLYILEAKPNPTSLDIWLAVGEISDMWFLCFVWSIQLSFSSTVWVRKWPDICLPPDILS